MGVPLPPVSIELNKSTNTFTSYNDSDVLPQLDGNISSSSFSDILDTTDVNSIPVFVSNRSEPVKDNRLPAVRRKVMCNNKIFQAASFPKFTSYNMRSLMPKVRSFGMDFEDRMCDLAFLCETWERKNKRSHNFKVEELFEMRGISYISRPRRNRSGGGVAIAANTDHYHLSKLNITIPKGVEIVWGLLKPKNSTGKITKIIVCSFYSPPKSKKKTALVDHMTMTIQALRLTYPQAGFIISGDRNDLSLAQLTSIDTSLKQIVRKVTRGPKILTVVLTDLHHYYCEADIIPPIDVDNSECDGVPSDHNGVVVTPLLPDQLKPSVKIAKMVGQFRSLQLMILVKFLLMRNGFLWINHLRQLSSLTCTSHTLLLSSKHIALKKSYN